MSLLFISIVFEIKVKINFFITHLIKNDDKKHEKTHEKLFINYSQHPIFTVNAHRMTQKNDLTVRSKRSLFSQVSKFEVRESEKSI